MEDIDEGLHPAVDGQSLGEDDDEEHYLHEARIMLLQLQHTI